MANPTEAIEPPRLDEMEAARRGVLASVLRPAPLVPLAGHPDVLLKLEIHQVVGCFKVRGILHAVSELGEEGRRAGLSTVSAGNTAKALAWAGQHYGVEARSLMPEHAPRTKIEAVEKFGGTPVLVPVDEVFRFLRERLWEGEPYAFVHPWTERDVMIGHGSLGLEIHDERPDVETVFLPVGGGGLAAGVASALKARHPDVRVVAVEPAGCPSFHAAREAGKPVDVPCDTICDGVAVPYMTDEMFAFLSPLVDDCVLIEESEVRSAIRHLALGNHVVAEGAGALAVAAALRTPASERGLSVAPVTGGSIDAPKLAEILRGDDLSKR